MVFKRSIVKTEKWLEETALSKTEHSLHFNESPFILAGTEIQHKAVRKEKIRLNKKNN